jgi:hypothetical protein
MTDRPLFPPEEVANRIARRVRHQPSRALIVLVEVPWSQQGQFRKSVDAALEPLGLDIDTVRTENLTNSNLDLARLRRLNMDRDLLRFGLRLLLLVVCDQATLGWVRTEAPDLAAMTDLVLRIEPRVELDDWPTLAHQIQAWSDSKYQNIDLSALSNRPADHVSLKELFLGLVHFRWNSNVKLRPNAKGEKRPALSLFLAPPGSGKTTFLRQASLHKSSDENQQVVILIPLPAYAEYCGRQGSLSLLNFLPIYLTLEGLSVGRTLSENLNRVVLLLDGLDEVANRGLRTSILQEVADAVDQDSLFCCIVAGRPSVLEPLPRPLIARFGQIQAIALTVETRQTYLAQWASLRSWDKVREQRLNVLISKDTSLQELAKRPLTLMLLALAFERTDELPRHRVQVYEAVNGVLVSRWQRARSMVGKAAPAINPYKILGPLAQRILAAGGVVHSSQLRDWLVQLEGLYAPPAIAEACAHRLITLLQTDAAVLGPLTHGAWSFAHPTLAEHLIAQGILQDAAAWDTLLATPFAPQYREVLLFVAATLASQGSVGRLRDLLQAVVTKSRRRGQYSLSYASLILGLLQDQLPGATFHESALVARLCPLWLDARYSPEVGSQVYAEATAFLVWAQNSPVRAPLAAALEPWLREPKLSDWWKKNFAGWGQAWALHAFLKDTRPPTLDLSRALISFAESTGINHAALRSKTEKEEFDLARGVAQLNESSA